MRIPDPRPRPPFAMWLFERGISRKEAAAELGCTSEWLRLCTLPYDDPKRARPGAPLRREIRDYTEGAVGLTDWEPKAEGIAA